MPDRKLRVFLCHASQDKPIVREVYQQLRGEGWIEPWLDKEKLLPGQDWDLEIEKAVEAADVVIVFLSGNSVTKEGYIQKEIRKVLDVADEKPEGAIFVVPLRLDDCPIPSRLATWHYLNFFPPEVRNQAYEYLLYSCKLRWNQLNSQTGKTTVPAPVTEYPPLWETALIGLSVGLVTGLVAYGLTITLCTPLGALPGGFLSSYLLLARRKFVPREHGLRLGRNIGIVAGIANVLIFAYHAQQLPAAVPQDVSADPGMIGLAVDIALVCLDGFFAIGFGWIGGVVGSHYFASRWK